MYADSATAILRNRTFRALFTAQVVALVGTGLLTVALGLLAYDLAGSDAGAVLGTALAIKMAAYVFVAPVVAALAYRAPRKAVLIGSDLIRAGIALTLPFVDETWQIYLLIFVLQAASAAFTPTFQSLIPAVLADDRQYTRGLALSRLAYDLESLLSPVLAAALLTVLSYHHLFLGTVVGFVLSATLVATTSLPTATTSPAAPFRVRLSSGSRVMFGRPVLRALLAMNLAVAAATALVVVNTVVYVRELLGSNSAASVAILFACYGAGSMIVALAIPRLLADDADRRVMLGGAAATALTLTATTTALTTGLVNWISLATLWVALGAATSLVNTPSARLLRYESTTENRSAVFTAQFSLSHACFFVTYPLAGWLGATAGQAVAAGALAVLSVAAAAMAARAWPVSAAWPRPGTAARTPGSTPPVTV
jgi:MFS family permease